MQEIIRASRKTNEKFGFATLLVEMPPRFSAFIYWSRPLAPSAQTFRMRGGTQTAHWQWFPSWNPLSRWEKKKNPKNNPSPMQEAWFLSYSLHCHSATVSGAHHDETLHRSSQQLALLGVFSLQPRLWMFVWIITAAHHFNYLAVPAHTTPGFTPYNEYTWKYAWNGVQHCAAADAVTQGGYGFCELTRYIHLQPLFVTGRIW